MLSQVSAAGSSSLNAAGRNAVVTSMMICCGFVACWSLNEISFFLGVVGVIKESFLEFWMLVQLNSCINPFIYAAKYRDFQTAVRKMLKKNAVMQVGGVAAAAG